MHERGQVEQWELVVVIRLPGSWTKSICLVEMEQFELYEGPCGLAQERKAGSGQLSGTISAEKDCTRPPRAVRFVGCEVEYVESFAHQVWNEGLEHQSYCKGECCMADVCLQRVESRRRERG